ncbi:MAG TPA: hypothetical protein VM008_20870 [Phycisphaerae bacterium]|nr:hypothetical protein [Phycisphaerae bacterium]
MELKLIRLRRIPKSKTGFIVDLLIGGRPLRTRAFVHPKFGHSIEFPEVAEIAPLFESGRKIRYLADAIVRAYCGEKRHYPIVFTDPPQSAGTLPLTVKPSRKPLSLIGAG